MSDETMVEVYDESLIPDELAFVSVRMSVTEWHRVKLAVYNLVAECGPRVPAVSLISARLSEACPKCHGAKIVCSFCHGFDDYCADVMTCEYCNGTRRASEGNAEDCPECGGSGKASVPGARLKEPGSHVERK